MEVKVLNRQHKQQQKKVAIMRAKSFCCKKRRDCIKRKTRELSVLCDIKACLVVLGPNGEVETWPENADDVREVIHMYQQFSAKNCCKNKRVFEPTVKVENPDDHVEEIVKENLEFGTAEVDSKFEILDEKTGLLNEEKGKEIVVFDCDENELNRKYLSELWELLEEEETSEDSRGVQLSNLELLSEQSCIPCFEPITEQNIIRYPQFCTNSLNNSGMNLILESISTVHENAPNIPQEFNSFNNPINHGLNFFPSESKKNIQFSDDQSFCFDSTNYESRIFDANLMPSEFYPQFQDGANFCGGTLLQPTMIADAVNAGQTIFGDSPQLLCPLPQEDAFVLSHQKLRILDSVYKASDTNIYEGFYLMQVVLSDGDLSTLSNMRLNLESNLLSTRSDVPEHDKDPSTLEVISVKSRIFLFKSLLLHGITLSGQGQGNSTGLHPVSGPFWRQRSFMTHYTFHILFKS
ncbi:hypothetical protein ACH5RR_023051 [Cinchona calisaya]|uniref:MADS-box domain-containing protein n=1 Tax=Cinchona calisaya TaxID=153742 RepID=A0ABD2Z9J7_9GENT